MSRRTIAPRLLLVLPALVFAASEARAQTVALAYPNPTRTINGQNQATSSVDPSYQKRASNNLNPQGINYSDCEQDLELTFSLSISGFTGGTNLEVWTGPQDCTANTARGQGQVPVCWRLQAPTAPSSVVSSSYPVSFYARDVTRYVGSGGNGAFVNYDGTFHASAGGEGACHTQSSEVAVNQVIYFVPIDPSSQSAVGSALQYKITIDMVGPPPPALNRLGPGDTLLQVNWTPQADPNRAGFQVFLDPPPGHEGQDSGGVVQQDAQTVLVCPDSGGSSGSDATADASSDASADALVDAAPVDAGDAGCYWETIPPSGGSGGQGACGSAVLTSSVVVDASTPSAQYDDAGNLIEGGAATGGGVSNIPAQYLVAEIDDPTATSTTITGLQNGSVYNVVVASIDRSLNVGPPSAEACDFPSPVDDFWKKYREAGGQAGGGFCALEAIGSPAGSVVGAGCVAAAVIVFARRRRRKA